MKILLKTFLTLLILGNEQSLYAQESHAAPVPLQYFGLHIHRADDGTAWPTIPFGSWRLWDAYVNWAQLEPSRGQWNFTKLDHYVAMARITNVEILLPLAMPPTWASARPQEASAYRPGMAAEPARMEDWRTYVTTVGTRYKGKIRQYEIWNEPSDIKHYTGSVEKLVEMTCEAYNILKKIDPDTIVVSPASAGGGRHIDYLDRFLAAGGKNCIDVVAHHFYVFRSSPEAMIPLIRQVRTVMQKHGIAKKPLWNTETGYWIENGDGTPDHAMVTNGGWKKLGLNSESGDYLVRAFLIARAEGVDRFYWYSWDNRYGLGMIEPTSSNLKPMVGSWRNFATKFIGSTKLVCNELTDKWSCSFVQKTNEPFQISWPK